MDPGRTWEAAPATVQIRDVSLYVEVVGHGPPLLLMHGGPGADHWTMLPFRRLADQFTLVFYDHRCNGRSTGAPVTSMTWENLTADADALREAIGFERWAVLGHSFGGHVALEYALRYPERLSHLILLDTGADSRWARENAARVVAERGYGTAKAELVRRWFHGRTPPQAMFRNLMRLGPIYNPYESLIAFVRQGFMQRRSKLAPEAFTFAGQTLLKDWSVADRLGEIAVPTLVIAGRDDFIFPPECQDELVAAIPNARVRIIDRAGHNPHEERTEEVMAAVRDFIASDVAVAASASAVPITAHGAEASGAARPRDLHVHETGSPGSPAVVFIHGGGPSGRMWRFHMDRLASRFHCLAPDLPGFGRSNQLASLSLAETADLVAELIATRVPAGCAHVVGLSYGASVLIALLERHPDRVDRAVVDGAAVLPTWGGWGDRLVQLGVILVSPTINSRLLVALLGHLGLREVGVELASASPRAFRRAYLEGFTAPASRALIEAPCPTLLVAGEKETTVRASNAGLAELLPHATARFVPGLGHAWFRFSRDQHTRMIEAWLSGEDLPPGLEPEARSPAAGESVRRQIEKGAPGARHRPRWQPR